MKPGIKVALLIAVVLLLDQWLKFYIKLNFEQGQEVPLLGEGVDWAYLKFVENPGMAFGIIFDVEYGKLALSVFRIIMVGGLVWYIRFLIRENASMGLLASVGFITAGAIGNIIDSAVYGLIFSNSPMHGGVAELVEFGKGYGTFLHGNVVDMLYFPIHTFHAPEWMPFVGGESFLFFSPIFNIADASITCGVLSILLFQHCFFKEPEHSEMTSALVKNSSVFADSVASAAATSAISDRL